MKENDHKGASAVSALQEGAIVRRASAPCPLGSHRPKRCDTVIASAVLVALIAGWVLNFVSVKQLPLGLGSLLAHATSRQT
jgi:hypothetical protein